MTEPTKSVWQRLWNGFLQTVGPRHFYQTFMPWVPVLSCLAAALLLVGAVWGLLFAPPDYFYSCAGCQFSVVDLFGVGGAGRDSLGLEN